MGDFTYNLKQYFSFDVEEAFHLLITALVAGFVIGFNNWGDQSVNVSMGLAHTFSAFLFVLIGLFFHVLAQKAAAIKLGAVARYSMWKFGLLIGLLITFLTNGVIPLFFTGYLESKGVDRLRVGKFPPRLKHWEHGLMSFMGPLMNLLLIIVAQSLFLSTGVGWLEDFIIANLLVMIYSMIPLPLFHGLKVMEGGRTGYDMRGGTIGFNMFLASRPLFMFFFTMVLAYTFLIVLGSVFSLVLAAFIALVVTLVWYFNVENQ